MFGRRFAYRAYIVPDRVNRQYFAEDPNQFEAALKEGTDDYGIDDHGYLVYLEVKSTPGFQPFKNFKDFKDSLDNIIGKFGTDEMDPNLRSIHERLIFKGYFVEPQITLDGKSVLSDKL